MIAVLSVLIGAALLIALWVWRGKVRYDYIQELAAGVVYDHLAADPWEQPRIVKTLGGIHDVEQDEWR